MKNDLRVSVPTAFCCACSRPDPGTGSRRRRAIAQEMVAAAQPMVQGVQVSAPFGRYSAAAEVLVDILPQTAKPAAARTTSSEGISVAQL